MSEEKDYKITEGLAPLVDVFIIILVVIVILFIVYEGVLFLASGM